MARSSSQGWGCGTMFVLWTIIIISAASGSGSIDDCHPLLILLIFTVVGIAIETYISKNQNEKPIPEKIKVAEAKEQEKRSQYVKHLNNVKYIGGHESFSTQMNGNIGLKKTEIAFYVSGKIGEDEENNGWVVDTMDEKITIPFKNITNIVYDTTEKITLGRVVAIGVFAALLKKKNNYFVVEYVNESDVKNTVIFDTHTRKKQDFLNEAIVLKNKNAKENKPKVKNEDINSNNKIVEEIRELAKLKEEGILTEEEFQAKKKQLLNI